MPLIRPDRTRFVHRPVSLLSPPPPPRARTVPATAAAARAELLRLKARHIGAQSRAEALAAIPEERRPRDVMREALTTLDNLAAEIADMKRRIRSLARAEARARRAEAAA